MLIWPTCFWQSGGLWTLVCSFYPPHYFNGGSSRRTSFQVAPPDPPACALQCASRPPLAPNMCHKERRPVAAADVCQVAPLESTSEAVVPAGYGFLTRRVPAIRSCCCPGNHLNLPGLSSGGEIDRCGIGYPPSSPSSSLFIACPHFFPVGGPGSDLNGSRRGWGEAKPCMCGGGWKRNSNRAPGPLISVLIENGIL